VKKTSIDHLRSSLFGGGARRSSNKEVRGPAQDVVVVLGTANKERLEESEK
jgi:hypothetical protein